MMKIILIVLLFSLTGCAYSYVEKNIYIEESEKVTVYTTSDTDLEDLVDSVIEGTIPLR